ncbi:MAG: metallophosphoesterase family protein [Planctomycetes bacterium]|nr:metallophosphoesterase family protein [Planctomycetota bacterium]
MPDPFAIVSDIHSNLEALQAVVKDIQDQNIKDIICLGDVIGYGPNPGECIDIVRNFKMVLMGNHDEGLIEEPVGFTLRARKALEWTRNQLKPNWLSPKIKKDRWKFIETLPNIHQDGDVLYVHASPRQPTTEYILRTDCDDQFGGAGKLDEIFSMIKHVCFVGHTHDPGIIPKEDDNGKYKFLAPDEINYTYEIKEGVKVIVNDGSVGQPRDGDNRACYVIFDGKTISFRRVPYDFNITAEKIFKETGLERYFGERLALGR